MGEKNKMYNIPWYVALLESVPEAFLILILGFTLFKLKIIYRDALIISLVSAFITFLLRQLPIVFGIHTLVGLLVMVFLGIWLTKISFWKVFSSVLAGITILSVLQSIILPICFILTLTTPTDLVTNPWLNVLFFLPEGIIMTIFYLLAKKHNLKYL